MKNHPNRCVTVSHRNPRYFEDTTGRILYVAGSHTWSNFRDMGETDPPRPFDFDAYLQFLKANNHNFFRLWSMELPRSPQGICETIWYRYPFPWPRTGPGVATDGKPRFDLSRFDESYFVRMRERVSKAAEADIVVAVMLFDGYGTQFNRTPTDGFPFEEGNNANGIACGGKESQSLSNDAVTQVQEAYLRRVIDTVNDLPNVLYEIANEAGSYSKQWQYHMINVIKHYESSMPLQHPVGLTFMWEGGSQQDLFDSNADWISPGGTDGYGLPTDPPAADGSKVIINDTDHSLFYKGLKEIGPEGWSRWAWSSFTRGHNLAFMDPYLVPWPDRNYPDGARPDFYWQLMRQLLGAVRRLADRLPLAEMLPTGELCSTGYCLSNSRDMYVLYMPGDAPATLRGLATAKTVLVTWIDPRTGTRIDDDTREVSAGGTIRIEPRHRSPGDDSVVLVEGK